ncbi:2184_t:CDS:2 [Diversispora eburnea]|uniref:2184_t:CDS:1 n=1 Tax=Diversispora eburnea TaxID=1213867 RepID=A0A9N9F928_9GLOM|nr:2184_t:CDS:2 [Diversispora eburnea]
MSPNNLTITGIPIWNSFICSQNLTRVTVETVKRGINTGDDARTIDKTTPLSESYTSKTNTNALISGDWTSSTGVWPCYIFNNSNKDKFKPGTIDQLIITAYANRNQPQRDTGLIFGIFDDNRPLNMIEPFTAGIPSINTFTFTLTEKVDINNKEEWSYTVNKQNTYIASTFGNNSIIGEFLYSPETYTVIKFEEKFKHTVYDIIGATGGDFTIALALWVILFGRGKYKSWGLIQRFILRNSPDVRKKDGTDRDDDDGRNKNDLESQIDQTQQQLHHSESNNEYIDDGSEGLAKLTSEEFTKKINKINEKLFTLEQTIRKHYLSGFKLHDSDLKKPKKNENIV